MMANRQVVLDTETTGLSAEQGHRIIEIGCVELIDRRLTGRVFHYYLNPLREVDEQAFKVHGLSQKFLADKPLFSSIVNEFIDFISNAELIIHNAPFDLSFINSEFKRLALDTPLQDHGRVIDTLELAKIKHPGQRNNLDALCKRYQIDASNRELHGALLDAQLLADVYLAMTSGQKNLDFSEGNAIHSSKPQLSETLKSHSPILYASQDEINQHCIFLEVIKKQNGSVIWPETTKEVGNVEQS